MLRLIIENNTQALLQLRDHKLVGNFSGTPELHIKPDLLLIYRLDTEQELILVRIGSHADLF